MRLLKTEVSCMILEGIQGEECFLGIVMLKRSKVSHLAPSKYA